jgi:hypothetical protein
VLHLANVTLFAASSVAVPETVAALQRSCANIEFGAIKFFCDVHPEGIKNTSIEWVKIAALRSRQDYTRFILKDLHNHINTDFALCVQWDGFILRPQAWRPQFLEYDYIGAPWPQFTDGWSVGNGGFSLRSARLLRATADDSIPISDAEDVVICRTAREQLEQKFGIRYAPLSEASRFSCERSELRGDEFGFHGVFNFSRLLGSEKLRATLNSVPIGMINMQDWWQMAKEAIAQRNFSLLLSLVQYLSRGIWKTT